MKRGASAASVHPDPEEGLGDGPTRGKSTKTDVGHVLGGGPAEKGTEPKSELLWCGPFRVGPVEFALYGPLQLLFIVFAVVAAILMVVLLAQREKNIVGIGASICLFLVCIYTAWTSKGLYLMKWLRGEVSEFRSSNGKLKAETGKLQENVSHLELETAEYKKRNEEHRRLNEEQERLNGELQADVDQLNGEVNHLSQQNDAYAQENEEQRRMAAELNEEVDGLRGGVDALTGQVHGLTRQNFTMAERNAEQGRMNEDLRQRVADLKVLERRLALLATKCGDNAAMARGHIEDLERTIMLDTVSTVVQFFRLTDRNKDGKITDDEIQLFVDSLGMLLRHLPFWDPAVLKKAIVAHGGITEDQVQALVEAMLGEEDGMKTARLQEMLREGLGDEDSKGDPGASSSS